MKKKYLPLTILGIMLALTAQSQDIARYAFRVQGPIPKVEASAQRTASFITQAYLNYMQSDSAYYPLAYYTSYMFYMNSRYTLNDTGSNLANELLLQSFSVLFDTILDANTDSNCTLSFIQNVTVDSLKIILGQCNHSGLSDTIVVTIDSVDSASGYITSTVLHTDTVFTGITGMSASNNWLNPFILTVKPNFTLPADRFAVTVNYFGSKFDTLGFLPGFGYTKCISGGSGPVSIDTKIGNMFGTLRVNSLTSGYQYFFGSSQTIPNASGSTQGLYVPCSNPVSKYWYFQDNPISAYISFTNLASTGAIGHKLFAVSQNYPNPFSRNTEITYSLKSTSNVGFYISDLTGRILMQTKYESMSAGHHVIILNAAHFGPGIYLYTFVISGYKVTQKMVISQ